MSNRTWSLVASMALLAGCAPGNPGLVVLNVIAPDDSCTYALANEQISHGFFDVAAPAEGEIPSGYRATIRYGNQLINLGNSGATGVPMADPNILAVQEVQVELRGTDGGALALGDGLPNPYTVPAGGGVIPSSDGTTAGEGLGTTTLIPASYKAALSAFAGGDVIVALRAVGTTLGGAEVVSNEFEYPITLCADCLGPVCMTDAEGAPICAPACIEGQDEVSYRCPDCAIGG